MRQLVDTLLRIFNIQSAEEAVARFQYGAIFLIQTVFVVALLVALYERAWLNVFVIIVAILSLRLPSLLTRNIRVHVPLEFEFLLAVFISASILLGEISGFYARFWWWDLVLHGTSSIVFGFIGFLIIFSLNRSRRLTASHFVISVFSFCFAVALGTLWEIFEFTIDTVFTTNMQKTGLLDTMGDLIVNATGALIAAVFGYFYLRRKRGIAGVGVFEYYLTAYFRKNS